jgi:chemotaxis family two-component system response regulator Rcp1
MTLRPVEILIVEDSPGDVWLIRETLRHGPVPKHVHVVTNGEQALEFLRKKGRFSNAVRPDIVLLDLNLPRRNGLEVLREVKNDPDLRSITVIVLTTSDAPADVNTAYDLNANCYVVKPVDLERFTGAIRAIERFWMGLASLPTLLSWGHANQERTDTAAGGSATNGGGPASHSHRVGRTVLLSARKQVRRATR